MIKIIYSSFFNSVGGYGDISRTRLNLLKSLDGVEVFVNMLESSSEFDIVQITPSVLPESADIHLLEFSPLFWDREILPLSVRVKSKVGVFIWEFWGITERVKKGIESVDKVLTISKYLESLLRAFDVPSRVFYVPFPLPEPKEISLPPELKDKYKFFSLFSFQDRKNPEGLLRAYFKAFKKNKDVVLIIKLSDLSTFSLEKFYECVLKVKKKVGYSISEYPLVYVITRNLTESELSFLFHISDAFVIASRGEGFCIPAFLAGLCGKPVIAPKFGGFLDYLDCSNSYLVDVRLEPVFFEYPGFNGDLLWGDPDILQLSEFMKIVYKNREESKRRGEKLREFLKEKFSLDNLKREAYSVLEWMLE